MKKKKVIKILKILAGIYLIIIGGCLLRDITLTSPENKTMLAASSIVFILTGIWYAFVSLGLKIKLPDFRGYLDSSEQDEPKQEKRSFMKSEEEKIVPGNRRNNVTMHSLSLPGNSAVTREEESGQKSDDGIQKSGAGKTVKNMTDANLDSVRKTEPADTDQGTGTADTDNIIEPADAGRETRIEDADNISETSFSDAGHISEETVFVENISDFEEKKAQIRKKNALKAETKENKKKKGKDSMKHLPEKDGADSQSNTAAPDQKDDKQGV